MSYFQSVIVSQKFVGNVDVKTKIVHFYVQRKTTFSNRSSLTFELTRLNEGGAMNLTSGIFTAPVPGIYHFEFSGYKHESTQSLSVLLKLNGKVVGQAYTFSKQPSDGAEGKGIYLTASLRLQFKDEVSLFVDAGKVTDNDNHLTHFTGWLVEQDLI